MAQHLENQSIGCDTMLQGGGEEAHIYRQISVTRGSRGGRSTLHDEPSSHLVN